MLSPVLASSSILKQLFEPGSLMRGGFLVSLLLTYGSYYYSPGVFLFFLPSDLNMPEFSMSGDLQRQRGNLIFIHSENH